MDTPYAHIPGGCILLARQMLESNLMDHSPLVVKLWVWLLLKANWKDRGSLTKGQLVTTIAEMQEAMSHYAGWRKVCPSPDQIRSAYGALTDTARITVQRTTRGMVVTILNYNTFQDIQLYASHTGTRNGTATDPAAIPHDTENKETKKKEFKPISPDVIRLSVLLADLVLTNNPKHTGLANGKREATIRSWSDPIDKLIRLDGQTAADIERIIRWSQSDPFWSGNILSGSTLRKQYDKLAAKALRTGFVPAASQVAGNQAEGEGWDEETLRMCSR